MTATTTRSQVETYRADGTNDHRCQPIEAYLRLAADEQLERLVDAYVDAVATTQVEIDRLRRIRTEHAELQASLLGIAEIDREAAYDRLASLGVAMAAASSVIEAAARLWASAAIDLLAAIRDHATITRRDLEAAARPLRDDLREYQRHLVRIENSREADKTGKQIDLRAANLGLLDRLEQLHQRDLLASSAISTCLALGSRYDRLATGDNLPLTKREAGLIDFGKRMAAAATEVQ